MSNEQTPDTQPDSNVQVLYVPRLRTYKVTRHKLGSFEEIETIEVRANSYAREGRHANVVTFLTIEVHPVSFQLQNRLTRTIYRPLEIEDITTDEQPSNLIH